MLRVKHAFCAKKKRKISPQVSNAHSDTQTPLTPVIASSDFSGIESTVLYFLDGASGVGDIVVTTGSATTVPGNGPGIYAASLSGAASGQSSATNRIVIIYLNLRPMLRKGSFFLAQFPAYPPTLNR